MSTGSADSPGADAPPLISIVVPTLDEAAIIGPSLDALGDLPGRFEIIVADGGSGDGTREIAARHPAAGTVIDAPRGRGRQMNAGAARAAGDVLLFVHADTRLPRDAGAAITRALSEPDVSGGNFRLVFDGGGMLSRMLGVIYAVQRRSGVFYGDSAIFVREEVFRGLGGYPDQPVMEDFEMARGIARLGRAVCLDGPAITSSRRWRRSGIVRTVTSWLLIRWLYQLGVAPERLARLYRVVR